MSDGHPARRAAAAVAASRLWGPFALSMALVVGVEAIWLSLGVIGPDPVWSLGMDADYYRELGTRYLASGELYLPSQLAGPYQPVLLGMDGGSASVLYPPHVLFLFVPFALIPGVFWWVVPLVITLYCAWIWRPAAWSITIALVLLAWPRAIGAYLFGNTDMWIMAAIAAGLRWGWPAVVVTIKPSLLPFSVLVLRWRYWWGLVPLSAAVVALMWPLWLDYVTAIRNAKGLGLGYSIGALPLMFIPVVLWLGRKRAVTESDSDHQMHALTAGW